MPPIVARRAAQRAQRSAVHGAEAPGPTGEPEAGAAVPPSSSVDAPVHIDRSSAGAAAAADLRANAFTSGDTIVLPSGHGPLHSGRGRSLLAHELVHVGQQRRLGAALPHESSPAGRQLEHEARSAEALVEAAPPPRSPGMPLARSQAQGGSGGQPPAIGASAEVRRAVDGALTLAGPGSARGSGEAAALASAPTGAVSTDERSLSPQRADASAPAPGPAPTTGPRGDDESQLDELARKLYERIRLQLGRELLLDRERSGSLSGSRR
jgi:hypothetical protein